MRRQWALIAWVLIAVVAGCADVAPSATAKSQGSSVLPASSVAPAGSPRPAQSIEAAAPVGAHVHVQLGAGAQCTSQVVCTGRLSVLPGGTDLTANPGWQPADADPTWQAVGATTLEAPPDGDLPILPIGRHLLVWSVTARVIVTDGPGSPDTLAARCSARVVVTPGDSLVTIEVRFAKAGGSTGCTLLAVASSATPAPTAASIAGSAVLPTADLPTAWRLVATPDLNGLGPLGSPIVLGVAPDGAFIGILSSTDRRGALVLRSVDGESWAVAGRLPDSAGASIRAVAGNAHAMVVAGWAAAPDRPAAWTSRDGMAWAPLRTAGADGLPGTVVLAANSAGFVASGSGSGLAPWISADPSSEWHHVGSVTANPDAGVYDIAPSGSGFVAVGWADVHPVLASPSGAMTADAGVWLSDDGRTWTRSSVTGGSGVQLWRVASQGPRLVAVGTADWPRGVIVFISTDSGRSWTPATGPAPDGACCGLSAVANGFLATTYAVWTSPDGTSWDDSAWIAAVGPATTDIRSVQVAASGARVVAAATYENSPPAFWIGTAR